MAMLNSNFNRLNRVYIFPLIEEKLAHFKGDLPLVNLGIGDIALPLSSRIARAICTGVEEMSTSKGIHGYGPAAGYSFLQEAICKEEFAPLGISPDEIFISDGANSDTVNILDLFDGKSTVALMNPTYPAYLDASILRGHTQLLALPCLEENGFSPDLPQGKVSLIYLCSPNNPTGMALSREELQSWVDYALKHKAILLIDNAYEAFITSKEVARSIFELPGALECAIEFRSFSKSAGFTGLRCAYTILPRTVNVEGTSLHTLWMKRQAIKFNGVAYPIQRGAAAVYSPEGRKETQAQIQIYQEGAKLLKGALAQKGLTCYGGVDSPYLWVKTPTGMSSWDFFDHLLERCQILSIPGCGFGEHGEGFVRLSSFTTPETNTLAITRLNGL